jgi:MtN3 and saliva related transmembrane protein
MDMTKNIIEFVFSTALFLNALLFIPQSIRILKEKSAKAISPITFVGFLLIQVAIIFHGVITSDYVLVVGYLFSFITCGSVVILSFI